MNLIQIQDTSTSQNGTQSQPTSNQSQVVTKSYSTSYTNKVKADANGESYAIEASKHRGVAELIRKMNNDGYGTDGESSTSIIVSNCTYSNISTSYSEDHGIGSWTVSITASWSGPAVPLNAPRNDEVRVQSN